MFSIDARNIKSFAEVLLYCLFVGMMWYSLYFPIRLYYTGKQTQDKVRDLKEMNVRTEFGQLDGYQFIGDTSKKIFNIGYNEGKKLHNGEIVNVHISPTLAQGVYLSDKKSSLFYIISQSEGSPAFTYFIILWTLIGTFFVLVKSIYLSIISVYKLSKESLSETNKYFSLLHHIKNLLLYLFVLSFTYLFICFVGRGFISIERIHFGYSILFLSICSLTVLCMPSLIIQLIIFLSKKNVIIQTISKTIAAIIGIYGNIKTCLFLLYFDFNSVTGFDQLFEEFLKFVFRV